MALRALRAFRYRWIFSHGKSRTAAAAWSGGVWCGPLGAGKLNVHPACPSIFLFFIIKRLLKKGNKNMFFWAVRA